MTRRALKATVTILLDPDVIGPEAKTEWIHAANAADWMSEVLSNVNRDTVLDWGYPRAHEGVTWEEVEISDDYEEGEMFG